MTLEKSTKPIVHIAPDEKFIKAAYDLFEKAFPGKNHFTILKNGIHNSMKHIPTDMKYRSVDISGDYLPFIHRETENAKIIIFHGMTYYQAQIALSINKAGKTFIWILFGAEIYSNYYLFGKYIYGKKTYRRFVFDPVARLKDQFRRYYYLLRKKQMEPKLKSLQAFKKMDYLGILYREEYEMITNKIGEQSNLRHLAFTYYPLGAVIQQDRITGKNILIGNSASYTNNHLEVFDKIEQLDLKGRKLIVPLSYGKNEYASDIIEAGRLTFGRLFEPLVEFMPLSDYQRILQKCGIVVMNHYRQQAVGNVLNTIYMGAKVYLSNKNTLYHYLKRIGCHVFCIEDDLVSENKKALELLSDEQQEENRLILHEELSEERVCQYLQQTINPLLN